MRARNARICSSRFRAHRAGLPAIEESIFAGVPVNVTLLFSREQYLAAAEAYMRGIERRIAAGLRPEGRLGGVDLRQPLGRGGPGQGSGRSCAIASASPSRMRTYKAYRELLASQRWQKLAAAGARPQRLLWASTGTKDPAASDVLYVEALAAPDTINTMPEKTLLAFADHGKVERRRCAPTAAMPKACSPEFTREGVDDDSACRASCSAKAPQPSPSHGASCWASIAAKSDALTKVRQA